VDRSALIAFSSCPVDRNPLAARGSFSIARSAAFGSTRGLKSKPFASAFLSAKTSAFNCCARAASGQAAAAAAAEQRDEVAAL
jgi:hypothetical protein